MSNLLYVSVYLTVESNCKYKVSIKITKYKYYNVSFFNLFLSVNIIKIIF